MPTIFPARRTSHAASAALRGRDTRSIQGRIVRKIGTLILITSIGFPMLFVASGKAAATLKSSRQAPISAPPEAFIVHKAETRAVASVLSKTFGTMHDLVKPATLPAGFESARLPTQTERLAGYIQPLLAVFTTSKSAIPNPNSEIGAPPPAGAVPSPRQ